MFDASQPDTPSVDAGTLDDTSIPKENDIGQACRSDRDCDELCIDDFPGGYCSASSADGECPDGSTCTPVGRGTQICLADCDPNEEDPCRLGYGCASDFNFPDVCIPGCSLDDDCAEGLKCDPQGGFASEGTCFNPEAEYGDACSDDVDCPSGGFCLGENFGGWPQGACIGFGCDVATNTGCMGDAQCIPSRRSDGLCIDGCEKRR